MPRIAAEIDAVTSPSWISLMRAPGVADLLDQVVMARAVEHDRRHVVHAAAERLGDRLDVLADRAGAGRSSRARAGRRRACACTCRAASSSRPGSPTAIIDIAPLPPRATTPRPFERVEREVDVRPAGADHRARRQPALVAGRAEDDPAVGSAGCRATRACPPPPPPPRASWSARPSQRAARERGVLGRAQVRLALARRRCSACSRRRASDLRLVTRVPALARRPTSTSSATAPVARFALSFSITGDALALAHGRRGSAGAAGSRRSGRGTSSSARSRARVAREEMLRVRRLVGDLEHAGADERVLDRRAAAGPGRGGRPRAPSTSPPAARARATRARRRAPAATARGSRRRADRPASGTASPASKLE